MKNIKKEKKFASGFCFYKYFYVFIIGCVIGYIYEMIIEYIQTGRFVNKQELIYGPFVTVYGIGILVFTIVSSKINNTSALFLITAFLGGIIEYMYSFFQEKLFGNVSWDYSYAVTNIDGRTTLLYAVGWGILGVIYIKLIYPLISKMIERIPKKYAIPVTWALIIFMVFNINISVFSSVRMYERQKNIAPKNNIDIFYDNNFPDEKLNKIYQNRKLRK